MTKCLEEPLLRNICIIQRDLDFYLKCQFDLVLLFLFKGITFSLRSSSRILLLELETIFIGKSLVYTSIFKKLRRLLKSVNIILLV